MVAGLDWAEGGHSHMPGHRLGEVLGGVIQWGGVERECGDEDSGEGGAVEGESCSHESVVYRWVRSCVARIYHQPGFVKIFVLVANLCAGAGGTRLFAQGGKGSAVVRSQEAACSLPGLQAKQVGVVDDGVLLDAYNSQVHLIRSLYVAAMVSGATKKEIDAGSGCRSFPGSSIL